MLVVKRMSSTISEDYKEVNGEYIRESILVQAKEVEKYVERTIVDFFSTLGYNITRIKEGQDRSVDYKYEDIGFEITVIHEYLPRINEIDDLLSQHEKTDSKVCVYMYGENGKVKIKKLQQTPLDKQSILSIRQHVSSYRPKLVNKLDDKIHKANIPNTLL